MHKTELYVILTEPRIGYQKMAEVCVQQEIPYLQLREKTLDDRQLLSIAKDIASITKGSTTNFIINDRIDIALLSGADGVHLGQNDCPAYGARILSDSLIIGLSTHSHTQLRTALLENPTYVGYGPVYATTTKAVADPVVGIDQLRSAVAISPVPVVAIGGIFPATLHTVLSCNPHFICLVRYLMRTDKPGQNILLLKEKINNYYSNNQEKI